MDSFLNDLVSMLQSIDPAKVALTAGPVLPYDTVVGTLQNPEIIRLYGLRQELTMRIQGIQNTHHNTGHHEHNSDCRLINRKIQYYQALLEATDTLLYLRIREEFPELYQQASFGLRQGWQVVWSRVKSPLIKDQVSSN